MKKIYNPDLYFAAGFGLYLITRLVVAFGVLVPETALQLYDIGFVLLIMAGAVHLYQRRG